MLRIKKVLSAILTVVLSMQLLVGITVFTSASETFKPAWPIHSDRIYYITSIDYYRSGSTHNGIDIGNPGWEGEAVYPVAAGTVTDAGYEKSMGYYVKMEHNIEGTKYYSRYMHFRNGTIGSSLIGKYIDTNTQIGEMGNTGESYGAHLHFDIANTNTGYLSAIRGKTFEYYMDNPAALKNVRFSSAWTGSKGAKNSQYWSWIVNNSTIINGDYALNSHTHTYNASGLCTNCGEFKPNQNDNAPLDKPGVYQTTAASNIKAAPYAAAGNMTSGTLPKGTQVSVAGAVVNGLGNTFYHVTYNGVSGYISADRLSLVKNIDSTLTINITSYPTSLNVGGSYGLRGSVTSNYNITKVTGAIINASGQTVMSTTDTPNATSMDVRYANLNNNLVFGNLKAGTYTLKIVATDTKASKTWTASFTVGNPSASAAPAPTPAPASAASTLSINMTSYPTSINYGSSYGLRGSVTSNYNITKVTGAIINASGQTVMSTTDTPNATSMDVRYANLNNNLVFNRLSRGTYTMKVVATDIKTTKTWTTTFTVK
ncbi:MAG: peptidoglycan DD-metalloendopeptidase family protein [Oscillospiraceae bacterium]|nr:peptidoglycan DD-metalloendopeptidase family protein [Oscillospiraceae bacterium]